MNFLKKFQPSIETLKQLDAYSKPIEDFRVKTVSGGTASILCWLVIAILLSKRVYEFAFNTETVEMIVVDTSSGSKLQINIDIVVPAVSCDYLALDAMDSSGEQHLHIEHSIFKRRLDLAGNPIEDPKKEEKLGTHKSQNDTAIALPKCGSCYGAENPERNITCCNTCEDVKKAYELKRWSLVEIDKVEQCRSTQDAEKVARALKEGCQIYGYLEVNRVGGSFHVAPGQSFSVNHVHVHDVQPFSSSAFNTSHIIRHLSFGKTKLAGVNPLDNSRSIATEGAVMYQYYIKIVPTKRFHKDGMVLYSNQFSVTKHSKVVSPGSGDSGMPGIFFSYELSALMVKISDKVIPWSHFLNDCCSCIGGVFIVFMLLDSFFYRSVVLWKKMEIGKAH
ncbi:endoplasmic reticulum-Golgi intermediate compartment protein 3-like [Macrosteles quadrilineatus]|uniref:endoplasmic reticulum-Golgi intermediate compartment protein 3-like n=1 Tax=Macrosteles quadrilineatus TaxID=74068 RepID=UPI0023E1BF37|nr:endoplasmic reticulum-Golgi intermediate compartment protein 3-like [Macrosteles quadrilineatus]XP_054289125.1 endoplasmic reticulum-Golgi intermediate compartment protein 3-like [Macrosteles quadrilineatus]